MRCAKKLLIISLTAPILSLILFNQAVFADETVSISISSNNLALTTTPEIFTSGSQTITASTSSIYGYTIKMITTGTSSAMTNSSDSTITFPTFTIPSGETSVPAAATGYGYGYSVDGGTTYKAIPEPTMTSGINIFKTSANGTNTHTLTFGALPSGTTLAGTYSNTFTIAIVANLSCPTDFVCYDGNDDDGTGTMPNQAMDSGGETVLLATNYSRPGYGFAGWNTESDGSGTNYGPNETVSTGNLTDGLQLYAKWIASAGNIQDWAGCPAMNSGDMTALTDTRDGNTYTVVKMADSHCWMTENLRLDLSDTNLTIDSTNTNNPETNFATTINTTHPASSNTFCESNNPSVNCINTIAHNTNNTNRNLTASYNAQNNSSSWYGYGHYYSWITATAGYGNYAFDVTGAPVSGDICPAGWRLPTGNGAGSDVSRLDIALGGTGVNQNSMNATKRWRAYPINLLFSGEYRGATGYNRSISGSYSTANTSTAVRADNFWLKADSISIDANTSFKSRGQTVRCIAKEHYTVISKVQYDANGGSGTMPEEQGGSFASMTAAINLYARQNFAFAYWNTQPDGNGETVQVGGTLENAALTEGLSDGDTLTLYAIWDPIYNIVYNGNNADAGSMSAISHSDVYHPENQTNNVNLIAPNYSKSGYGFAGWNTKADGSGTNFGPNQVANITSSVAADADTNHNITLYANWVAADSNYTMQTFTSSACSSMSVGDVIALTDTRDGNTYAVAKLVDNHCWMTENLRLDPSTATFTATNTNGMATGFDVEAAAATNSNSFCNTDNTTCVDKVAFNTNNINRALTAKHNTNNNNSSWYSYGVYYNWYTATAGNGVLGTTSGSVNGDICPAGWRLPTGGSNGEYDVLNRTANATMSGNRSVITTYPYNFLISGDYTGNAAEGRNSFGRYWTSTATGVSAYRLGTTLSSNTPTGSWKKWVGFTVRCLLK